MFSLKFEFITQVVTILSARKSCYHLCDQIPLCLGDSFQVAWDTAAERRGGGWLWDAETTNLVDSVSLNCVMLSVIFPKQQVQ